MHFRRALLLFAIVLGLAALAASISRSPSSNDRPTTAPTRFPPPAEDTTSTPTLEAGPPLRAARTIRFDSTHPRTRRVRAGTALTVVVDVDQPGQVDIPALGVSDAAEPLTPATFDVLPTDAGPAAVLFTPAGSSEARSAGTLLVRAGS
ncbi:MAG TPA: hypothetical protein VGF25_18990 [Thermoleophilaceae bacterium]